MELWSIHQLFYLISVIFRLVSAQNALSSARVGQRPVINFCVIMEEYTVGRPYDYRRSAAVIDLAIEYVGNGVLRDYELRKYYRPLPDDCSLKNYALSQAMDLHERGIICNVFIGPGCGSAVEVLSDYAEYYNRPVMGIPAAAMGISAPAKEFVVVTRLSYTYISVAKALMQFFLHENYTSPTILADRRDSFYSQMLQLTETAFQEGNFDLYARSQFYNISRELRNNTNLDNLLQTAARRSRVFVVYADSRATRRVMMAAQRCGMTGGDFVFIAVDLFPSPIWGTYTWNVSASDDEDARLAFKALLLITIQTDSRVKTEGFWDATKKLARERYRYFFSDSEGVDLLLMHNFDAVLTFANIYRTKPDNMTDVGTWLSDQLSGSNFTSPISGNGSFNEDGDRRIDYVIRSFTYAAGRHDPLFVISEVAGLTQLGAVDWFGQGSLPPNEPRCGFDGLAVACQIEDRLRDSILAAYLVVPLLVITLASVVGSIICKRVYFTEKDPFWWRVFLNEIEASMTSYAATAKSTVSGVSVNSGQSKNHTKSFDTEDDEKSGTGTADREVAIIGGVLCGVYELPEPKKRVPKDLGEDLKLVRRMEHQNIQVMVGIVVNDSNHCVYFAGELCGRGSLRQLIADPKLDLDWVFKNSLLKDLVSGMNYLHASKVASHGYLTDEWCHIDSRFVLKIAGHGLGHLQSEDDREPPNASQTDRDWRLLLYRAPELLRRFMPHAGSQKGDIYAFAILMQQIILRSDPYDMTSAVERKRTTNTQNLVEIVMEVKRGSTPPTRPNVRLNLCPPDMHELMELCWSEEPAQRPPFTRVRPTLLRSIGKADDNIVDHLIHRMEVYSAELEQEAETKMKQFMEERQRSADLLSNILPKTIAQALLRGQTIYPETYPSTTVYFGDIHGFAEAVEAMNSPVEILGLLNRLYAIYDEILVKYDVYQVEAVNDAYLVVSGLPVPNGTKHVSELASLALDARRLIRDMKTGTDVVPFFRLRVGLNSGPCVAGVVGLQLPRYCLFGDTVNTASRMESHGEAGKIHCSESTKNLLDRYGEYIIMDRGEMQIKGKGLMKTYWLVGKN